MNKAVWVPKPNEPAYQKLADKKIIIKIILKKLPWINVKLNVLCTLKEAKDNP